MNNILAPINWIWSPKGDTVFRFASIRNYEITSCSCHI